MVSLLIVCCEAVVVLVSGNLVVLTGVVVMTGRIADEVAGANEGLWPVAGMLNEKLVEPVTEDPDEEAVAVDSVEETEAIPDVEALGSDGLLSAPLPSVMT